MFVLYKGEKTCTCNPDQLKIMEAAGWSKDKNSGVKLTQQKTSTKTSTKKASE